MHDYFSNLRVIFNQKGKKPIAHMRDMWLMAVVGGDADTTTEYEFVFLWQLDFH